MPQKTILIKNADYIITFDKKESILKNKSLLIEGKQIKKIGTKITSADYVINAKDMIVIPGLINCHHHLFQCGLRGMPKLQNQKINKWINIVCKYAKKIDDKIMYYAALTNMAELLLYGCTTTTDMHYLFPKGNYGLIESTIQAAKDIGIRFHPYRGSMSLSKKNGQLFPDKIVESSEEIYSRSEKLIKTHHDPSRFSMLRVGIAPCTVFSSSASDFKNAVLLARKYNINLQTHLSESRFEDSYVISKYNKRPLEYLQSLGWIGPQVSFVHGINLTDKDIKALRKSGSALIHCPISNARKPVGDIGIAPITELLKQKITVGVGTDGSAGNDSSNVLEELRWARTLQGARESSTYLNPLTTLAMATKSGAKALRWDNTIGSIENDKAADIALFNLRNNVEFAGANDPITALISCQAKRAETVIVNGKIVVDKGLLTTFSEEYIINQFNSCIHNIL